MIELLLQAEAALSVGLLDRAEELYRQVAGADPRNSIAVVGLARVALERSDEVGAVTLARRALVIDPDNNAAQRMVQRLEEVLRHRGVAVAPAPALAPASDADARVGDRAATAPAPAEAEVTDAPTTDGATTAGVSPAPPASVPRSYLDRLLRRR